MIPAWFAHGAPTRLSTAAADADGDAQGSFYAAATTETGPVVVWVIRPTSGKTVDATQIARVAVGTPATGSSKEEVILAAALEGSPQGVPRPAAQ